MGNTALITGGTRGIGLGIATELARSGFSMVLNGIREEPAVIDTLDQLRSVGREIYYVQGDISVTGQREALHDRAIQLLGKINILVNNAGVAPLERRDILETTPESYDRVMEINLKGPFFLTQLVARHMVEKKEEDPGFEAAIINISSISASVASINRGEYCISKAGVSMASRLWAIRMGAYDIPVYEVQPGIVDTDMTSAVKDTYKRLIEEGLCIQKRMGTPEDVGKVVAALAKGDLPYATGQVIRVDGGLTIPRL
jgi:NAD(P)-dependent dehydrogenase (short-subunit alcohol dehydrogenase family)